MTTPSLADGAGKMPYRSIVRDNLMEQQGYSPYCGAAKCFLHWPRTKFTGKQFRCDCGWHSTFELEFIAEYKAKWAASHTAMGEVMG